MKIIIIGIAGFVGSSLTHKLLADNHSIIGIDDFSFGYKERLLELEGRIEFIESSFEAFSKKLVPNVDLVINCAAVAPLPENQKDHYESLRLNVALCGAITDFCTRNGVDKIVHFSSAAVYENSLPKSDDLKSNETDDLSPMLTYPVSKWLSEMYFETQSQSYGLNIYALRLFNLYGPRQDYFRKQPPLIGYLLKSILSDEEIVLFADEFAKRDYIFIDDLSELVVSIIEDSENRGFTALNVGSGKAYSVYDIVDELSAVIGRDISYKKGSAEMFWAKYPDMFARPIPLPVEIVSREINKKSFADVSKAEDILSWTAKVSLKNGLQMCFQHAKKVIL